MPGPTRIPRRAARVLLAVALAALAAVAVLRSRPNLAPLGQLGDPAASWLAVAVLAELASLLAYAALVRELLRLGGLAAPVRPLLRATIGGIALGASLPGGQAVSAAYWYRQLRRVGADGRFSAVAMGGAMAAGGVSLGALLVAGVAVAGCDGPLAHVRLALLGGA